MNFVVWKKPRLWGLFNRLWSWSHSRSSEMARFGRPNIAYMYRRSIVTTSRSCIISNIIPLYNRERKCAENHNKWRNKFLNCSQHFGNFESNLNSFRVLFDKIASVIILFEQYVNMLVLERASPGNRHCASCIGALSFPMFMTACYPGGQMFRGTGGGKWPALAVAAAAATADASGRPASSMHLAVAIPTAPTVLSSRRRSLLCVCTSSAASVDWTPRRRLLPSKVLRNLEPRVW